MEEWNSEWASMPWKYWTSPAERFQVLPSFVIGEFAFILLTLVTLVHAVSYGRRFVLVWFAAFIAGTANDAIFMMLPMVDNFWQAQACIMLTPRMPLYIPCVYNVFMYCGFVASEMVHLPLLAGSCLAGLLGEAVYAPYDITGAKFLWWTWHDTDAPIRHRILGAPIGSSVWVITFTSSFYCILNYTLFRRKLHPVLSVLLTGLFSTPVMVVQMSLLQLVSGDLQGLPTHRSLASVLVLYCACIAVGYFRKSPNYLKRLRVNYILLLGLVLLFTFFTLNMGLGSPESHLSTGVHQEYGDCRVEAPDISGHYRQVFLCKEAHNQDFTFDCESLCGQTGQGCTGETTSWYTVCGRRHTNYNYWLKSTAAICTVSALLYTYTLTMLPQGKQKMK